MRSREMDKLSDYITLHVMLGCENINSIERKLAKTMNGPASDNNTEALSQGEFHHRRMKSGLQTAKLKLLDMMDC